MNPVSHLAQLSNAPPASLLTAFVCGVQIAGQSGLVEALITSPISYLESTRVGAQHLGQGGNQSDAAVCWLSRLRWGSRVLLGLNVVVVVFERGRCGTVQV